MEPKKEIRIVCLPEIYERINAQAANLGQKPGSFARQIIMEKVVQLELQDKSSFKLIEALQKIKVTSK